MAKVRQQARFTITCHSELTDPSIKRVREAALLGGFFVSIRGASTVRARIVAHEGGGSGSEHRAVDVLYKAACSGTYKIVVSLFGAQLPGSPFQLTVITPKPVASMCEVSGAALTLAVARATEHFDVRFRDALGAVAIAEEIDVWVVPVDDVDSGSGNEGSASYDSGSGDGRGATNDAVLRTRRNSIAASVADDGSSFRSIDGGGSSYQWGGHGHGDGSIHSGSENGVQTVGHGRGSGGGSRNTDGDAGGRRSNGAGSGVAGMSKSTDASRSDQPTYVQQQVEVGAKALVIRASCELVSAVVGQFPPGQLLRVLAERAMADGSVRALVEEVDPESGTFAVLESWVSSTYDPVEELAAVLETEPALCEAVDVGDDDDGYTIDSTAVAEIAADPSVSETHGLNDATALFQHPLTPPRRPQHDSATALFQHPLTPPRRPQHDSAVALFQRPLTPPPQQQQPQPLSIIPKMSAPAISVKKASQRGGQSAGSAGPPTSHRSSAQGGSSAASGSPGQRVGSLVRRLRLEKLSPPADAGSTAGDATQQSSRRDSRPHPSTASHRGAASSHRSGAGLSHRGVSNSASSRTGAGTRRGATPPAGSARTHAARGEAAEPLLTGKVTKSGSPPKQQPGPRSPVRRAHGVVGWVTLCKGGVELVLRRERLDPWQRQQQRMQWARRQRNDKNVGAAAAGRKTGFGGDATAYRADQQRSRSRKASGGNDGKRALQTPFMLELAGSPRGIGFAFGGVEPGTLHAHGQLHEVHKVSYSVGLVGRYLLHIALRSQETQLPGSPFELRVVPGPADARSTVLVTEHHQLRGIVGVADDCGCSTVLRLSDKMGNMCIEGGAVVTTACADDSVVGSVDDNNNGTYLLTWRSRKSGTFAIDVLLNKQHIVGSPVHVQLNSIVPDLQRTVISGDSLDVLSAGMPTKISLRFFDEYNNLAQPLPDEYAFGVGFIPPETVSEDAASKLKAKEKTSEKGILSRVVPHSFLGEWSKEEVGVFTITFRAVEAGAQMLHVWCMPPLEAMRKRAARQEKGSVEDTEERGARGDHVSRERQPLPGSPFAIHVHGGQVSVKASIVGPLTVEQARDAPKCSEEAPTEGDRPTTIVRAGDAVVIRPALKDLYGNLALVDEGAITATLSSPSKGSGRIANPQRSGSPVSTRQLSPSTHSPLPHRPVGTRTDAHGAAHDHRSPSERSLVVQSVMRGGNAALEVRHETSTTGWYAIHVRLHGYELPDSPVTFTVLPTESDTTRLVIEPPPPMPLQLDVRHSILMRTRDRFDNWLTRGGLNINARMQHIKQGVHDSTNLTAQNHTVSVEDRQDGTYLVGFELISCNGKSKTPPFTCFPLELLLYINVELLSRADLERDAKERREGADQNRREGDRPQIRLSFDKPPDSEPSTAARGRGVAPPPAATPLKRGKGAASLPTAEAAVAASSSATSGGAIRSSDGNAKMEELEREVSQQGGDPYPKRLSCDKPSGSEPSTAAAPAVAPAAAPPTPNRGTEAATPPAITAKAAAATTTSSMKSGGATKTSVGSTKKDVLERDAKLLASSQLREEVKALRQQAADLEVQVASVNEATFERRVGAAIAEKAKAKDLKEVMREWDKNGDGELSKMELRTSVRNILGVKAENKEIDAFMASIDRDGSGSVDLTELKAALKRLRDAYSKASAEGDQLRAAAAALDNQALVTEECAASTEAVEQGEAQLSDLQANPDAGARLGALLAKKNINLGEMMSAWDADGDSTISKSEFRGKVLSIGFAGSASEVDALFDSHDADGCAPNPPPNAQLLKARRSCSHFDADIQPP